MFPVEGFFSSNQDLVLESVVIYGVGCETVGSCMWESRQGDFLGLRLGCQIVVLSLRTVMRIRC